MRPVVLDTDVVSFLFKRDSRGDPYQPHLEDREWLISFMTEAELEHLKGSFSRLAPSRDLLREAADDLETAGEEIEEARKKVTAVSRRS